MADNSKIILSVFFWLAVQIGISFSAPPASSQTPTSPNYAPDGRLNAPTGFESWVFVGSNLGMSYNPWLPTMTPREAARSERQLFHNVYINPEAYAHFVATGRFPEPTILVMEIFAAADKEPKGILATGVFNGERVGLEVAVKNSHRPDGQTTPWAYYEIVSPNDPSNVNNPARAAPDSACESCHRVHASRDNVWVQFYPILRRVQTP